MARPCSRGEPYALQLLQTADGETARLRIVDARIVQPQVDEAESSAAIRISFATCSIRRGDVFTPCSQLASAARRIAQFAELCRCCATARNESRATVADDDAFEFRGRQRLLSGQTKSIRQLAENHCSTMKAAARDGDEHRVLIRPGEAPVA